MPSEALVVSLLRSQLSPACCLQPWDHPRTTGLPHRDRRPRLVSANLNFSRLGAGIVGSRVRQTGPTDGALGCLVADVGWMERRLASLPRLRSRSRFAKRWPAGMAWNSRDEEGN